MYEVINDFIDKHFDEREYSEAYDFAREQSEHNGRTLLRDWEEGIVLVFENGERVRVEEMFPSDDPEEDWEEEWADADYDDYDEPYDPYDEVGYDPYTGGYDSDL